MENETGNGGGFRPKINRHRVVDQVREQLTAEIKAGNLKVNERLPSENELARTFGVSRPVIREALTSLEALGLTSSRNGSGTFVIAAEVKAELLLGGYPPEHLNQVRRYLELPAAELAARHRSRSQLAELTSVLAQMEKEDDPSRRNNLDADFHVKVAAASGNGLLAKLIGGLRGLVEEESFAAASELPYRRSKAQDEHRHILEAIAAGDPVAAVAAMATHLDAIDDSVETLRQEISKKRRK
jgi:DNA-binding FadR family transcriptional regulator